MDVEAKDGSADGTCFMKPDEETLPSDPYAWVESLTLKEETLAPDPCAWVELVTPEEETLAPDPYAWVKSLTPEEETLPSDPFDQVDSHYVDAETADFTSIELPEENDGDALIDMSESLIDYSLTFRSWESSCWPDCSWFQD